MNFLMLPKKKLKIILPLVFIFIGIGVAVLLFIFRPTAEKQTSQPRLPVVTVKKVLSETVKIPIFSRGTVKAGTDIVLTSEVQGRVQSISTSFAAGAFFEKDETLLNIDPANYKLDLAKARSHVAKAELNLARVKADVRTNRLGKTKVGLARISEAKAQLNAAQADEERVKILLSKTNIRAPFSGRVLEKAAGIGQYVTPGMQLGRIFATQNAQIHLPLSDTQLALIDVPYRGSQNSEKSPQVHLKADYGKRSFYWRGKIIGTEGGVNARNRLLYLVAQIENPFGDDPSQPLRPPLTVGKFVEAEIEGSSFDDIFIIPREAVRNSNEVLTVNKNQRIRINKVEVLYRGKDNIYIRKGLNENDFIVMTPLDVVVDGMRVLLSDAQQMELTENNLNSESVLEKETRFPNPSSSIEAGAEYNLAEPDSNIKEALPPESLPEQ